MEVAGEKLRQARSRSALTMRELADASGVSHSTIWQLESGRRDARPSTLRKLAAALGVAPVALMADELVGSIKEENTRS